MKNQTEQTNVFHCKNCGGVYDPAALSECPFCGVSTEENQAAPAAATATVADYAGGFGQPGSTISRVASAIAIALLLLSVGTLIYLGGTIFTRGGSGILKPDTSAVPEGSTSEEQEPEVISVTIKLDTDTITLAEGESYPFDVTLNPADWEGELVWSSDNEDVAAVVDGTVTNVNGGDCTITVSADTATATCKVHCEGMTLEEKKAAEEQAKREKEEAERKKAEEEKKKAEEEKKRKEEEERQRKEEEERRKAEEEAAAAQQASGGLTLTLYGNTYDDNDFTLVHVGEAYEFEVSGGSGSYSAASSDSDVASVSGTRVTATGVGVATITWSDGSKSVSATIRVNGY